MAWIAGGSASRRSTSVAGASGTTSQRTRRPLALPSALVATSGTHTESCPEVTIVVPTYRRPHRLSRLVEALEAETLPPERFEVVIVDNASPDDTFARLTALAAASPLRLRNLTESKRGPAPARNAGWRTSMAPVVAFVDDDCVPEPGWLAGGLAAVNRDDRIGVVQGCTRKPDGAPLGDWTLWRQVTGPSPFFEACNIFYRRAALEQAGGFDEAIGNYGEDTALGWSVLGRLEARLRGVRCRVPRCRGSRRPVPRPNGVARTQCRRDCQAPSRLPTRRLLATVGVPA